MRWILSYEVRAMLNTQDPEDRRIRILLLSGVSLLVLLFLGVALAITVMVSYNFNIMNWLE